jgi:hypothetical protein
VPVFAWTSIGPSATGELVTVDADLVRVEKGFLELAAAARDSAGGLLAEGTLLASSSTVRGPVWTLSRPPTGGRSPSRRVRSFRSRVGDRRVRRLQSDDRGERGDGPIGTLMSRIGRQDKYRVSAPPMRLAANQPARGSALHRTGGP